MNLSSKQRAVLIGMLIGALLTIVGLGTAIVFSPVSLPMDASAADRIAFALQADILVAIWLAICVGRLARHRFFTPEDIDGGGLTAGTERAHVLQAGLQNTLEQAALAVLVHLIWVVYMPVSWAPAVPAAAILFFLGRILFIRGYTGGAPSRALGFALTFYPSVLMLVLMVGMAGWRLTGLG